MEHWKVFRLMQKSSKKEAEFISEFGVAHCRYNSIGNWKQSSRGREPIYRLFSAELFYQCRHIDGAVTYKTNY